MGSGEVTPPPAGPRPTDEEPPGGPFRTWGALYATVVVYAAGVIVLLYVLGVTLSVGTSAP